jgi:hypothetical protein
MKLCPLRPATRVGQTAIAIQMMRPMMPRPNHAMSLPALVFGTSVALQMPLFNVHCDQTWTARPSHHADWVNGRRLRPPIAPPPDVVPA